MAATPFLHSQTFYSHTLSVGAVNLTASRLVDDDTFYNHAISLGAVNLSASTYSDADTFYSHTLGNITELTASTFVDADTFYAHTVDSTYALLADPLVDGDTFYTHEVSVAGSIDLTVSRLVNSNVIHSHRLGNRRLAAPRINALPGYPATRGTTQRDVRGTHSLIPRPK